MKVHAVLFQKPRKSGAVKRTKRLKQNRSHTAIIQTAVPVCCAVCSLFGGVFLFCLQNNALSEEFYGIYQSFTLSLHTPFAARWIGALSVSISAGIILLYLGTSPIAAFAVLPFLSMRAFSVGAVAAWLYSRFGSVGITYYFVCFFPGKGLEVVGLSLLAQKAIRLSVIQKSRLQKDGFSNESILFLYLSSSLPGMICLLISSFLSVLMPFWFSSSFPLAAR